MPFDPIASLVVPSYSAAMIFIWVGFVSFVVFRLPSNWSPTKQRVYWRGVAFAAEVFVIVGLLGLFTYAGRARIDANVLDANARARASERELSIQLHDMGKRYCLPMLNSMPPLAAVAPALEACRVWKEVSAIYKPGLNWIDAKLKLQTAASARSAPAEFASQAASVATQIELMLNARREEEIYPHRVDILRSNTSWTFIVLCAIAASLGVAIKCARALADFIQELKIRGATRSGRG